MILYHATTALRGKKILSDGRIKKEVERYYTKEENGDGYTSQGYIYLSNEVTFAIYFANCHDIIDKTGELYVFRVEIPDNLLEPDNDELRCQGVDVEKIAIYGSYLSCGLTP